VDRWFRGALRWNRLAIVLAVAVGLWALILHEGVRDLVDTTHQTVANESLQPFSSVRVAKIHDNVCAVGVFLSHIAFLNPVRLRLDRLKDLYYPLKQLSAHFLLNHLVERALVDFFIMIVVGHSYIFNECFFEASEDSPPLLDTSICEPKELLRN
jgi:hypothetical protein